MFKKYNLIFLLFVLVSFSSIASHENEPNSGDLKWYVNLDNAYKASQESGKPIFAFFTGSDWCGWCHKLQREVFAKEKFIKWAKENVILLELDFPRRTPQDETIKQQNAGLQQAFGVRGYPTIWIFNMTKVEDTDKVNIAALGSLGYPSGAVQGKEEIKFLENANAILANGQKTAQ